MVAGRFVNISDAVSQTYASSNCVGDSTGTYDLTPLCFVPLAAFTYHCNNYGSEQKINHVHNQKPYPLVWI